MANLFTVMRDGGLYGNDDIPWFNGGLFKKIKVPQLSVMEMTELRNAAALNWSAIDVSIFGTLFERGLDPSKRSQLGAHYTDPATIMRIVEPVLQRPLLQIWEHTAHTIHGLMAKSIKKGDKNYKLALAQFVQWLDRLRDYRVLDPACGSGNFLFLGLKTLKDIEHQSHLGAAALGLDRETDLVTGPHNMLGIELNEYAAELARVTVWIGELQWRLLHGYEFKTNPVLEPLDHIECRDALLTFEGGEAKPVEATWPQASVVIGNPPFLGGSKKRRELGDDYFAALDKVFTGRVPGGADLVCYWLDKGRKQVQYAGVGAVGLVTTNSIRGGANQAVLKGICSTTNIFNAWSDEGWINEGASVRVSLVCFGAVSGAFLNGFSVSTIHADLTAGVGLDLTKAVVLKSNTGTSFQGSQKIGSFDISGELARSWLHLPNPNGRSNSEVLKPSWNGIDVARRSRDGWIVDFGIRMSESDASLFETPFQHVAHFVKPERELNKREAYKKYWWRHGEPRVAMRAALSNLPRYFALSSVTKHIFWRWLSSTVLPDKALIVVTRADETTFGILHSRLHELWSLRVGTSLEDRPRYTPTTCFETFPFPAGLSPQDTASQATETLPDGSVIPSGLEPAVRTPAAAIAKAAKHLNDLRENWLNPAEWTERIPEVTPLGMTTSPYPDRIVAKSGHENDLADRTLTKLYTQRPAWLDSAHKDLDLAVAAAYDWPDYTADMADEEILKRLLALNLARASTDVGLSGVENKQTE